VREEAVEEEEREDEEAEEEREEAVEEEEREDEVEEEEREDEVEEEEREDEVEEEEREDEVEGKVEEEGLETFSPASMKYVLTSIKSPAKTLSRISIKFLPTPVISRSAVSNTPSTIVMIESQRAWAFAAKIVNSFCC
jgi:hypothetical protein